MVSKVFPVDRCKPYLEHQPIHGICYCCIATDLKYLHRGWNFSKCLCMPQQQEKDQATESRAQDLKLDGASAVVRIVAKDVSMFIKSMSMLLFLNIF